MLAALALTATLASAHTQGMLTPAHTQATLASTGTPSTRTSAHTQSIADTASLRLLSADGDTLIETGKASGGLPGTLHVSLTLRTETATSRFTIHARGGTVSGRGTGKLKMGKGGYYSFGGEVSVTGGTGRFRGAHGTAGLYGTIFRVTDAIKLQVKGKLHY